MMRLQVSVPELPEFILVWLEGPVFPGPGVSSAVSHPHVVPSVSQHVSQTGVGRVGDPVTAGSQEAMLEEDHRPRTCRRHRLGTLNQTGEFWSETSRFYCISTKCVST